MDFQGKNKNSVFKRIFYSGFGIAILGVLLLTFAWGVVGLTLKMQETTKNKKIAQQRVSELEKRKEKLASDIENLNTDEGKEKIFREDFGMGKEGEGLIIVVEDQNKEVAPEESPKDYFSFFRNWFK